MVISSKGMIEIWPWRNFGEKGPGIFGQRAEVEAVDGWSKKLYVSFSEWLSILRNMAYIKSQKKEWTYDPERQTGLWDCIEKTHGVEKALQFTTIAVWKWDWERSCRIFIAKSQVALSLAWARPPG